MDATVLPRATPPRRRKRQLRSSGADMTILLSAGATGIITGDGAVPGDSGSRGAARVKVVGGLIPKGPCRGVGWVRFTGRATELCFGAGR